MFKNGIRNLALLVLVAVLTGCSGNTNWQPVADQICQKYEERVRILQGVKDRSDAAEQVDRIVKWQREYEALNDQLVKTVFRLRDRGGSLDFQKFDILKKQWAQIDESVLLELKRLNRMNGIGPDYDQALGEFTRTLFNNPFR